MGKKFLVPDIRPLQKNQTIIRVGQHRRLVQNSFLNDFKLSVFLSRFFGVDGVNLSVGKKARKNSNLTFFLLYEVNKNLCGKFINQ